MTEIKSENPAPPNEAAVQIPASEAAQHLNFDALKFVSEQDGYRYYEDPVSKGQYSVDASGYWFIFNQTGGFFEPLNIQVSSAAVTKSNAEKEKEKVEDKKAKQQSNRKRYANSGVLFDEDWHPIYPKNEKGMFILPKDAYGQPFFPVDNQKKPVFPWDSVKKTYTFPVDDTDEPIFPRNEQNKPIVPQDEDGKPIFPLDRDGQFIFPLDESHCPTPALTLDGNSVVPKDEYGNFVIPKDRDGKPLIQIASDGVTAISMAEWKQWKKYYKDHARALYHQQQVQVNKAAAAANSFSINSMFHPLNLEQQHAYLTQDIEMLQRGRRVRPEDIDLPNMSADAQGTPTDSPKPPDATEDDVKALKRKKLLREQLNFTKKTGGGVQQKKELVKNGTAAGDGKGKSIGLLVKKKMTERGGGGLRKDEDKKRSEKSKRKRKHRSHSSSSNSSSSYSSRSSSPKRRKSRRSSGSSKNKKAKKQVRSSSSSSSNASESSARTYSSGDDAKATLPVSSTTNNLEPIEYGPVPPSADLLNGSDMSMSEGEQPRPRPPSSPEQRQRPTSTTSQKKKPTTVKATSTGSQLRNAPTNAINPKNLTVDEVAKSDSLDAIKQAIEQTRGKYQKLKVQIAELEVERSMQKRNLAVLRDAEKRLEERRGVEYLSSSGEDSDDR